MYSAQNLNAAGLFQHVGGWVKGSQHGEGPRLEELLYRATCAHLNVLRLAEGNRVAVQEFHAFRADLPIADDRIIYWSPIIQEMLGEIPSLLATVRQLQNLILPIAHAASGKKGEIPKSINDAMKRINDLHLHDGVRALTKDYWKIHGSKLRDYRDLDQHYLPVANHTYMQLSPDERIVITLPDNPEERSAKKVSFASHVDGIRYCTTAFTECHAWIDGVARALGFPPTPIEAKHDVSGMGPGRPGLDRGLCLIVEGDTAMAVVHKADGRVAIGRVARALPPDSASAGI